MMEGRCDSGVCEGQNISQHNLFYSNALQILEIFIFYSQPAVDWLICSVLFVYFWKQFQKELLSIAVSLV